MMDAKQAAEGEPQDLNASMLSLPSALLVEVLQQLPQKQSAALSLAANAPLCVERVEGWAAFAVARSAHIQHLLVAVRRLPGELPSNLLLWPNIVASVAALGASLKSLTLEYPDEVVLSAWAATLTQLKVCTVKAPHVVVRPGLHTLASLTELRFKSTSMPLTFVAALHSGGGAGGLLPPGLRKLRLEGCNLGSLPPAVAALGKLEDLVLSDNVLTSADLQGLWHMTSLQQLTLMGCRCRRLPPSISALHNLQVLYLDMALDVPAGDAPPTHVQINDALAGLPRLAILSLGACHLEEFPTALVGSTSLRALYLDDNSIPSLPDGPYLKRLRVLGCDWRTLFASHALLTAAPVLSKLCLMSPGKGMEHSPANVSAVVVSVTSHPALHTVLLPLLDGLRGPHYVSVLNVIIGISRKQSLDVRSVTYNQIGNEWLEWLEKGG